MRTQCLVCKSTSLVEKISFISQPISNRFLIDENEDFPKTDIKLGICLKCGVIQLLDPTPYYVFRPIYDWLTYNEPEAHLDHAVSSTLNRLSLNKDSLILGVTYKDQSTLNRFSQASRARTEMIEYTTLSTPFGLETIQNELVNNTENTFGLHEKADLVVARHIIEHTPDVTSLLNTLLSFTKTDGYLLIEFPDNRKVFSLNNYPFLWEEHMCYLLKEDSYIIAENINCTIEEISEYEYTYENSVVLLLKKSGANAIANNDCKNKERLIDSFSSNFESSKKSWHNRINEIKKEGYRISVFGAGHLSFKFINFFELEDLIDIIIDDNVDKIGTFTPGSNIPITSSMNELDKAAKSFCISTLSPESKTKVLKSNRYMKQCINIVDAFNS